MIRCVRHFIIYRLASDIRSEVFTCVIYIYIYTSSNLPYLKEVELFSVRQNEHDLDHV